MDSASSAQIIVAAVPPHHVAAALVHLVGFLTGAALYATLFGVVTRRRAPLDGGEGATDWLPLLTAVLGLIWNLTGLAAYAIRDFAGRDPHPLLIAAAYAGLGLLPAVVVHSVLRSDTVARTRRPARAFICAAYAVSTLAGAMLLWSALGGIAPSAPALRMLTWAYAVLTVPVLLLTRKRPSAGRAWSIVALAVFAISALHLSHQEGAHEPLAIELLGHHASIPLIFAILYQDFRFALADVFLKRALAVFALVAIASWLYVGVEIPLLAQHDFRTDSVAIGVSVIVWVAMALSYPLLQRSAAWTVDRLVLHRPDYAALLDEIGARVESAAEPELVLTIVAEALRGPLAAEDVWWSLESGAARQAETMITIPTTEAPRYQLTIGRLDGGRRLLSDDTELLRRLASLGARRIDAIRLEQERGEHRLRERDMSRLATEAELRALRSQVNPHFLFNALNTIGFLIQTSPSRAQATLMKLSALLRGVLRSGGSTVTLGDELDLVAAYLDIERARFEERLAVHVDIDRALRAVRVPPLIIQPLVENAIKHGIARCRGGGEIAVSAHVQAGSLRLSVSNTGAPTSDMEIAAGRRSGMGLANLEARLRQQYGSFAWLTVTASGTTTTATLVLPLAEGDVTAARRA
jgi:two-component system LytT family sensor kinase